MDKTIFQEYPEQERLEMIDSNADGVESMDYTEYLTEEELSESKAQFAQKSIEEAKLIDTKKEVMDEFKQNISPIQKEKLILLQEIKFGSRSLHGKCFKIIDYDKHEVGFYNPRGQLVYSRPAKPEESQKTLMSLKRTGTN